jgi:hypothetical protein
VVLEIAVARILSVTVLGHYALVAASLAMFGMTRCTPRPERGVVGVR